MTAREQEQVLCAATNDLPQPWLPAEGTVALEEAELARGLQGLQPFWLPRQQAEQDERFKQLIPYVLLRDRSGLLAAYPRRGQESRLHGCWSLGIGGHLNPVDAPGEKGVDPQWWTDVIGNGLHRELAEEFPAARAGRTRFLGLIHESRTAVGRVHLGVVFLHDFDFDGTQPGPELAGLRWVRPTDFGSGEWPEDRFELWSRLALRLLPIDPV